MKRCLGCLTTYNEEYDICPSCGFDGTSDVNIQHYMQAGTLLHDRYLVGKVLGYGGFGITYLGWDTKLEQAIAIKEYLPSEYSARMPGQTLVTVFGGGPEEEYKKGLAKFVEEGKKLAQFQNTEGIVTIHNAFDENNTAYIIMEYLEGETLAELIEREGPMDESEMLSLFMPVLYSLEKVHAKGMLHRDIAPDNLIVTKEGHMKLIDFGASRHLMSGASKSMTVMVKVGYSPEEQYQGSGNHGEHSDVYAIASTMYKCLTGITPPDAVDRRTLVEIKRKDLLAPISRTNKEVSLRSENAILNAMNVQIDDRTSTITKLIDDLTSEKAVARVYGNIKRADRFQWPLWAKIGVPAVCAMLFLFGVLLATGTIRIGGEGPAENTKLEEGIVRVPNVVNTHLDDAEEKLENIGLQIKIAGQKYSMEIPMSAIYQQVPDGGGLAQHQTVIEVVISAGAKVVKMPNVIGLPKEEAEKVLTDLELVALISEEYSDTVASGCVIRQSEEAQKELKEKETVTLVVSKGIDPAKKEEAKTVTMPDLVGLSHTKALELAKKEGIILKIEKQVYDDKIKKDIIMKQSIKKGTEFKNDQVVNLTVSLGEKKATVPFVVGATEKEGVNKLKKAGLEVTVKYVKSETFEKGLIVKQSVAAKKEVKAGTKITIEVAKDSVEVVEKPTQPATKAPQPAPAPAPQPAPAPAPVKKTVTINYDANGGSGAAGSSSITEGTKVTVASGPSNAKKYTVTYDANGGTVSSSTKTVACTFAGWNTKADGSGTSYTAGTAVMANSNMTLYAQWRNNAISSLATPTRNYYTFKGWTLGGSVISTTKVVSSNVTLKATWQQKDLYGNGQWLLASSVPAGAQIVNSKWQYEKRETKSSSKSALSGWTKYDTSYTWSSYGSWSLWSKTKVTSSDSRNVETRNIAAVTKTQWHYYAWRKPGRLGCWSSRTVEYTILDEIWSDRELPQNPQYAHDPYVRIDERGYWWICAHDPVNHTTSDKRYTRTVEITPSYTEYRYRDRNKIYTYYYERWVAQTTSATSSRTSAPSGSGIRNAKEYVQYRPK